MMNEVQTIRCKIDKNLPFENLCQRLDEQLEQNVAEGTIRLTPERDGTITVTYRNRAEADAKHVFKMVCDIVDISEAKAQGRWSAQYPPVKIEWLAASKPRPEGVCTDCGNYTFAIGAINEQCGNMVGKMRCAGVFRSNMNWETCQSCNGTGKPAADDSEALRNDTHKCSSCQGSGWQAVRRTQQ
jgi:ArsR family metal-binding transcriptional regulator